MRSRVMAFRVSDNVYRQFEKKCKDEGVSQTVKLRELVDSACHERDGELEAVNDAHVKVIQVKGKQLEKVTNTITKSWFPFDFSPLFGKER